MQLQAPTNYRCDSLREGNCFSLFLSPLSSSMVSKSLFPWKISPWELVRLCNTCIIVAGPIVLARKYLEDEDLFFVFNRYLVGFVISFL